MALSAAQFSPQRAAAALVIALALQVATNYVNDYADGVRGADDGRVGPVRLVASGLETASRVRTAAVIASAVAGAAGLWLAAAVTWWLVPVGAACMAAGWFYTAGPRPYGYAGFGEVFVFVFFGLVATTGTAFVQMETITALSVLAALPVACLVTAILVANNLRDIPSDAAAGKRTLAVRIGDSASRALYVALVAVAAPLATLALVPLAPLVLLGFGGAPLAVRPIRLVASGATGRDLVAVLSGTATLHLAYGALLSVGIAIS